MSEEGLPAAWMCRALQCVERVYRHWRRSRSAGSQAAGEGGGGGDAGASASGGHAARARALERTSSALPATGIITATLFRGLATLFRAFEPRRIACTLVAAAFDAASDSMSPPGIRTRTGRAAQSSGALRAANLRLVLAPIKNKPPTNSVSVIKKKAARKRRPPNDLMFGIPFDTCLGTQHTLVTAHPTTTRKRPPCES